MLEGEKYAVLNYNHDKLGTQETENTNDEISFW